MRKNYRVQNPMRRMLGRRIKSVGVPPSINQSELIRDNKEFHRAEHACRAKAKRNRRRPQPFDPNRLNIPVHQVFHGGDRTVSRTQWVIREHDNTAKCIMVHTDAAAP